MSRHSRTRRIAPARVAVLLAALGIAGLGTAPSAVADPCAGGTTTWTGLGGDGSFTTDLNWDSGSPTAACDAVIDLPGVYTVSLGSGVSVNSLAIGTTGGTPTLSVSAATADTDIAAADGITVAAGAAITLDCPLPACAGGPADGPRLVAGSGTLSNAGTITVMPGAGTGAGFTGDVTNTGTIQIDGDATHTAGTLLNQGTLSIADSRTLSSGSSCTLATGAVVNGAGGQIVAAGTGTLSAVDYDQGAGSTSGWAPVTIPCGALRYSGAGASSVRVTGSGAALTGDLAAGQTLRIASLVVTDAITNAGTITFDQSTGNPVLATGGATVTNLGTIATNGASANAASFTGGGKIDQTGPGAVVRVVAGTRFNVGARPLELHAGRLTGSGTISGSVENVGGTVAPGSSPGVLTISGNYVQGAGGGLEIAVDGTGVGQASTLAAGGVAILQGTLQLVPGAAYAAAAAVGESVVVLTHGGDRGGTFASTTVTPALAGGRSFAPVYGTPDHGVSAVVTTGSPVVPPVTPPAPSVPSAPKPAPDLVDATAPALTAARIAPRSVRAGTSATLRLSSSEAASLQIVVTQRVRGRKRGARCTRTAKKGVRCTLVIEKKRFTRELAAGAATLKLSTTGLKPGTYKVALQARDVAGNASEAYATTFVVKAKPKPRKKSSARR